MRQESLLAIWLGGSKAKDMRGFWVRVTVTLESYLPPPKLHTAFQVGDDLEEIAACSTRRSCLRGCGVRPECPQKEVDRA